MVGQTKPKSSRKHLRPKDERNIHLDGTLTDATTAAEANIKRRWEHPEGGGYRRSLRGNKAVLAIDQQNQRYLRTATIGTLNNLVIPIKFRNHNRRAVPSREDIDILINSEEADPVYAPTGSLKMVYWENSYGQLTIDSLVTDWILVSGTESYYAAGESGVGSTRIFQEALVEALDQLERQGFDFLQFDQDNDSHIDSIAFLTSGYGAEWGGSK